jgi:hypothetical protein
VPFEQPEPLPGLDDQHDYHDAFDDHVAEHEVVDTPVHDDLAAHDVAVVEPDHHDPVADLPDDPAPESVFPPAVDVGDLPEPVDGFPWIDTGSLGVVDPAAVHETTDPVRPEELAEYAGTDLPPGVDPWAALADSDDPATSTLARWWTEN